MVAAIRPKPVGVSSYSRSDLAVLVGLRRPDRDVAGACGRAPRGPCGRALGAVVGDQQRRPRWPRRRRSKEISFSRSRLRRALMSMSTRLPLLVLVVCAVIRRPAELDLHVTGARPRHGGGVRAAPPRRDRPASSDGRAPGPSTSPPSAQADLDQPTGGAAPVARLGERAVDAGRGDLEHVRRRRP